MKRIILLEICFLFLATTFQSDNMTGWVQQTIPSNFFVRDLQFLDSLTGFIVQSRYSPDTSFISKTTDGGNNWIQYKFNNIYLTSIKFIDNNIGYSAGRMTPNGNIQKTTNGGQNWLTISTIANSSVLEDIFFVNKDTGWVCSTDIVSGCLWRTINGGLSWQTQLGSNVRPSKIFFINSITGWVIGNAQTILYKTTNCGTNWFVQKDFNTSITDVFFTTIDTGWIVKSIDLGRHDALIRSTNGGSNWDTINAPIIPTESRLFFIDNKRGWAGSGPNKIFVTKDGYNWGTQYSPKYTSYNVWFVDSLHGWAGYGGLVHTIDGGGPITYTGIKRNGEFIPSFELGQNYPNPFNPSTKIKFSILKSCTIELRVFDISGREIAKPVSSREYNIGEYVIDFNSLEYSISSGIYFYTMRGETTDHKEIYIDTKKMLLVK